MFSKFIYTFKQASGRKAKKLENTVKEIKFALVTTTKTHITKIFTQIRK